MNVMKSVLASAALAIAAISAPAFADQNDPHGRFALGHLEVMDSNDNQAFRASTVFYRYVQSGILGEDNLSVNVDGAARFSDKDYNDGIPGGRVLMANVKYKKFLGFADVTVGRSFVEEFVSEMVDGMDAKIWLNESSGFGVFGGARPDPYKDTFNPDYNAWGGYVFTRTDIFGASGGYALDTFKGTKDRERANAYIYFMPAMEGFHFQASVDLDNLNEEADQESGHAAKKGWDVTNALAQVNWRVSKSFVVSATYNDFHAINREASHGEWRVEMLEDRYTVARIRAEAGLWRSISLYGGADQRNRQTDSKNATQMYAGLRDSDFFFNTRWDVRYSDMEYFTSKVKSLYASIGATIMDNFNADASVTWLTNNQNGQMGDLSQTIYELNMDYWITKNLYAVLSWQYSSEKYLDVKSVYSTRYADNFNTTTLYGQLGYRF